ncbi:MAG: glutamate-5-semialdehyde dehydrogenase [Alphaproteobacteria bacterium]|nr:MAG: glutamate-5-semialdehyde dehydrogenase [Alphaproteobacteria bacterium]
MQEIGKRARAAAAQLALASAEAKNQALHAMASSIRAHKDQILTANAKDMEAGNAKGLASAMLDRLLLNDDRIEAMANGIEAIAAFKDPIGDVMAEWTVPSGLKISRVRVPLGVIGIIYESRPNVTADAGALCLKAGNAAILRGGSESFHSSGAIHACLVEGLKAAGLPEAAIQLVPTTDREAVGVLLRDMGAFVDVIIPRGGRSLIERVQTDARVPVMGHLEGICHIYIHEKADLEKAIAVTVNAKLRRPGICGAAETLLIDEAALGSHLGPILDALIEGGCEIRGDEEICALEPRAKPATEDDWYTEYLDKIISVKTVSGIEEAMDHIRAYGSGHTESILTEDEGAAHTFLAKVDSAIVMHNASTQFADGGEFGMGAEIGIATGKLHARGPVGAAELTSYKYQVRGNGTTRP